MRKKREPVKLIIEFTDGYEERFTNEILKIYESRSRRELQNISSSSKAIIE